MIAEAFAWLTHKRLETSGERWRLPALVSLWVISFCWVAFGVLLWSADNLVAQNAAIVGLLTAAVVALLTIPRDVMERSITHALPFGIYEGARQVGFAPTS